MAQQMRITPGIAMRVRDVSRPRPEDLRAAAHGTADPAPPEPQDAKTPPPRKRERRRPGAGDEAG